jgi:upstream activation factor subunit UAF30
MPTAKSARKPKAALMKPIPARQYAGEDCSSKPLPRSEVTTKIWHHIKKDKLHAAKKETLTNTDDALQAVFGGKKKALLFL